MRSYKDMVHGPVVVSLHVVEVRVEGSTGGCMGILVDSRQQVAKGLA